MRLTDEQRLKVEYNKGFYDGGKEMAAEILNQMALERCDPDVMPYFEDYYWLPKSVWQALRDKCLKKVNDGS